MSIKQDSQNRTFFKRRSPILQLSLIYKVIKESIYDQTQDYLPKNELLHIYQSRANYALDTCLSCLTGIILKGAENKKSLLFRF